MKNFLALLFLLLLPFSAASEERKLRVVSTFSILEDFAKNVGGEKVEVFSLVGTDNDAHVYEPTPADVKKIAEADVVVTNGLGFEGWISRLTKQASYNGIVAVSSSGVKKINGKDVSLEKRSSHEHAEHSHMENLGNFSGDIKENHNHGKYDPHAWHDVQNAIIYVKNIEKAFSSADKKNKKYYAENTAKYIKELEKLDKEIKEKFAKIPKEKRKVVTSHDAFEYFAKAYGFKFLAPQGVSTESEASAKDVASLIKQIREHNIKAVFVENISDARLIKQISDESGANLGGKLYSDALSKNEEAATYIQMMRHNIGLIHKAIK